MEEKDINDKLEGGEKELAGEGADNGRRKALAKLAKMSYTAPVVVSLLASKKVSALTPPPPP